jgi:putative membrane protein
MHPKLRGALAGAIGGLAGTLVMNYVQRVWTISTGGTPGSSAGLHDARDWQERSEGRNSNEEAALVVASLAGRRLTDRQLAIASVAIHFSFGASVGALYGLSTEARRTNQHTGLGLGVALWLTADEIAMPVLRLSESTLRRPLEMHLQSLAAHLAYGVVTERVRRGLLPNSTGA